MDRIAGAESTIIKRAIAAALICGAAVALAFTHLSRDKWVEVPLALLLTVVLAAPAAVLTAVAAALNRGGRRMISIQARALLLAVLSFCAASWVELPVQKALAWYDQSKARDFCEYLSPAIERYRIERGEYPDDVVSLVASQGNGKLPKLIENGFQYYRREGSFVLAYIAPDRPFAWNVFESGQRGWRMESDD